MNNNHHYYKTTFKCNWKRKGFADEATRAQRIVTEPWSPKQPWLNSVSHKTNQKDMNMEKSLVKRRGQTLRLTKEGEK